MNKRDLVKRIAADAQLTQVQAARAVDSFLEAVQSTLTKGNRVTLMGFGSFVVAQHKARMVRDPRRGVPVRIAARPVARFAAGLELKAAIENAHRTEAITP